ncbi:ABC transporter ATP-binding protein [Elizabethkingia sp. JS20170427COW]|uniref:ABC transporter ATP-binding protein n=1 Tax=Elizabethkingia sp. JS20170427COW TaxID=2583851 RepID=UPI001110E4D4|nr:ATP-binding cassette domain-containing protein [Elizabethkingia sp. JS20170427COW]QCX53775.1 ATP-binding cassette domain-containing protein [Elizabethkingia sp. JS20170427COW]
MKIEIKDLTKSYGDQKALNSISLTIDKHEIIGLLGPNGAGKSTLMKIISGVLKSPEDSIRYDGVGFNQNPEFIKSRIGFLPENNPLYSDMYVKEYLGFVANLQKVSKDQIDLFIDRVGISPEKNKKIHQLSKGYKQRVGLAAAILHQPELLILDEPTNGLDPNQILEIRNLIREIGQEKTVILSTHILQEVEALCTRVILIHQGRILQDTSIESFKGKYSSLEEAFKDYTS